jgi:hypothetical protein
MSAYLPISAVMLSAANGQKIVTSEISCRNESALCCIEFPVLFPVCRELAPETDARWTASTAIERGETSSPAKKYRWLVLARREGLD